MPLASSGVPINRKFILRTLAGHREGCVRALLLVAGLGVHTSGCADAGAALRSDSQAPAREPAAAIAQNGEELIRALGCAACHADLPRNTAVSAAPAITRLSVDSVYAVLRRRPVSGSGARMPYFHLDEREALALALYLGQGQPRRELLQLARREPALTAAQGQRIFAALNCAGCHTHPDHRMESVGPLLAFEGARVRQEWLRNWLQRPHAVRPFGVRPGSGARMPDFALSGAEADSITTFLLQRVIPLAVFRPSVLSASATSNVDTLLSKRWSCLGCHAWDGRGGRIGPDLAMAGNRLRPEFVRAMLENPQHVAPGTIMPRPPMPAATLDRIASRIVLAEGTAPAPNSDSATAGYLSLVDHATIEVPADSVGSLYASHCAPCHGAGGEGNGYNAAHLRQAPAVHTQSAAMSLRPDDAVYDAIAAGGFFLGRSPEMPGFVDLEPSRVRALVAWIRALCRCSEPAWAKTP
jgi:mono/diheme cytochrome c family protein